MLAATSLSFASHKVFIVGTACARSSDSFPKRDRSAAKKNRTLRMRFFVSTCESTIKRELLSFLTLIEGLRIENTSIMSFYTAGRSQTGTIPQRSPRVTHSAAQRFVVFSETFARADG